MASFYNNYYRYYRPYPTNISNAYPVKDKSSSDSFNDKEAPSNPTDEPYTKASSKKETSSRYYSFGPIHFKNPLFDDIEEPIFEIFGIQLYLDDIIILGLLFFLYQENVQDEILYIALILLLLS